jgi:hypothetical protein
MRARAIVFSFAFLLIVGCANLGGKLTTIRSPGVERIPTTICIHPLLSSPVRRRYIQRDDMVVTRERGRVYIASPTEVRLSVTPQSQMFTGLLSSELAYYGFDLKELPVEIPDESEAGETKSNIFFISLDLLKRLKEEYGIEAILIGNVMMDYAPRYSRTLVTAAYLKLVDIESLDVLCQVHLLSEDYGEDMDRAADALASELALEAGLARIER